MRYVALLYSITLSVGARLVMSDWTAMLEGMGLRKVRTLIATGNAVFETAKVPVARLERKLEDAFEASFGKRIATIVRTADDWLALAAANPFPHQAQANGSLVMVRVGRGAIGDAAMAKLAGFRTNDEGLAEAGSEVWSHYGERASTSRMFSALSRIQEPVGTLRNWNTVQRIAASLKAGET